MRPIAPLVTALALALAAAVAGCGKHVGDKCNVNADCSPLGDRFCDVASPGGYCTIEGCDVRLNDRGALVDSCQNAAGESVCVRFFSPLARTCDPTAPITGCAVDERCLCEEADPTGANRCMAGSASHCAKESSERRWCMLKCTLDAECRMLDGYRCIAPGTGNRGAVPVPSGLDPDAGTPSGNFLQKFCIFQPSS